MVNRKEKQQYSTIDSQSLHHITFGRPLGMHSQSGISIASREASVSLTLRVFEWAENGIILR